MRVAGVEEAGEDGEEFNLGRVRDGGARVGVAAAIRRIRVSHCESGKYEGFISTGKVVRESDA